MTATAETSTVARQSPEPEVPDIPTVQLRAEKDRLIVLGVSLMMLFGFGIILEGMRRRADAETSDENTK